jgi:DNA-directed RNA polymerase subunit alpha
MEVAAPLKSLLEQDPFDAAAIDRIRKLILSNAAERKAFREEVDALRDRLKHTRGDVERDEALKVAVGAYLLGRKAEAAEWFPQAKESKERRYFQALSERDAGEYAKAIADFERAESKGWDSFAVAMETVETHRIAGEAAEAEKILKKQARHGDGNAEWHFQQGMLQESQGHHEPALEAFNKAVQLDESHQKACFHAAYLYDLRGEEREAIRLYRLCVALPPTHVNALINLALLLEDMGHYEEAAGFLDQVLRAYPDHPRALMYRKDVTASTIMVFDEEAEKVRANRNQVLEIPVTDFELSVRSRNCLKKMNIRTLGDLLHVTEADLLSYKNFGETSLNEIKQMLTTRTLRLGQALEEATKQGSEPRSRPKPPPGTPENVLNIGVQDLEFSVRSRKCLQRLGIGSLGDLITHTDVELLAVKNFGQTSLQEIKRKLAEYSLSLRQVEK